MGFNEGLATKDSDSLLRIAKALEAHTELLETLQALHERIQKSHDNQYSANDEVRELEKRNLNLSYEIMQRNLEEAKRSEARWKAIDESRTAARKDGK